MEDTIIIEDLEIWPEDLDEMTWDEATASVTKLGPGWRLPTRREFRDTLYPNRNKLGFYTDSIYWSSTELATTTAWTFTFTNGTANDYYNKNSTNYVRAVRDFSGEAALEILLQDF